MATLKDIARAAGVSIATVSNVVNGTKAATPQVHQRVHDAIERLGYVPNPHAQSLRTGQSRTLGLVVPDLTNPYFPALVQAIETTARGLGYVLIVMDAGNDADRETEALTLLAGYRVAGVVWVPVDDERPLDWPFPIVTVDRPVRGCDTVAADHAQGGALIAAHAIALDHRRVGLLSGPRHLPSATLRRAGFLRAIEGRVEVAWEHEVPFSSDLPAAARTHLHDPDCSLVVAANDAVAVAVVRHVREAGLGVPEDVAVIGFDDVPWADFVHPGLTTVRQPLADLGASAVGMLHARIADPSIPLQQRTLPVELVVRRSTERTLVPAEGVAA
ncbi:MAG: LacI family DNA-binding transcriptional regulator [Trueperaceae bacterium]